MSELEFLCGLILLILGFNIGYYEANKGLTLEDFKKMLKVITDKIKK